MANDVLRRALSASRLTERQLAERIGVDPATVSRWVADEGRVPQPRLRWRVAAELQVSEADVWPSVRALVKVGADREVAAVYASHAAVPGTVWQRLVSAADREIMLCGTRYDWLWYQVPDLTRVLREKAEAGTRVRVVVGDPADPLVAADEESTGAPETLSVRIQQTEHLLAPLRGLVEVRRTGMGYGRGVIRGDDDAAVHLWVHGALGTDIPVLLLQRRQSAGLFDQMAVRHAEALWEAARPVWE